MKLECADKISELNITLKQLKSIMDLFTNEYTSGTRENVVRDIDNNFDNYVYAASVVSDLIFTAAKQAGELETAAAAENIKAV